MPLFGSRGAASVTGFGGLAKLGYLLRNSLRFRASNSAYLSRTGGTPSNGKTATYSFWMKRGILSTGTQWIFTGGGSGAVSLIGFNSGSDSLSVLNSDTSAEGNITTAVFRDPAAWYHIVIRINTTEGSAVDRAKIYVNGVLQASPTTAGGIGLDATWNFNTANILNIGRYTGASGYSDLYLAEIHFIDGGNPPLPSAFAKTDPATGQWVPIKYLGTYGNNGFYLPFTNTTSTSTLGNDFSGNGNTWTVNNFSLTAGSTYDSMTDVPTLTSTTTANYCVLNPVSPLASGTISNANLTFTSGAADAICVGTFGVSSGKWYWEITATNVNASISYIGIIGQPPASLTVDLSTPSNGYCYLSNGNKGNNNTRVNYGATFTSGDVIGVALDMDAGTLVFYKNNATQGTAYSSLTGTVSPAISDGSGASSGAVFNCNFGQRPFAYTAPSGFLPLNTFNL